jgi:hypothetical protein
MRNFLSLSESLDGFIRIQDIPDVVNRQYCCEFFNTLAAKQRGEPERLGGSMNYNDNLHPNGTGLYTHTTEHMGDLIERMTATWATGREGDGSFGYEPVKEKVMRTLGYMNNDYGFEREIREQVERNYTYYRKHKDHAPSLKEWWSDLEEAGIRYANAYAALPAYNDIQWLAREAAISIGNMDYDALKSVLSRLAGNLKSEETWIDHASVVRLTSSGKPVTIDT